jgi:hypothetical protein
MLAILPNMSKSTTFDTVGFIMSYENGELDEDQVAEGVQALIDNGTIYHLQGHYGRLADSLQSQGLVTGF